MSQPTKRSAMQRALRARDDGLRKVSVATRALVAGAVAGTGLFTILASTQPGHATVASAAAQPQGAASASAAGTAANGNGLDTPLSPPAASPVPADQYASPPAVSGAS